MVQAVALAPDEGALELAQQLLGGLGPVLVHRVRPAPRDPGQEIGVVPGPGARQGVLHPGRGVRVADVPDPVQRQRDHRRGPGRDLPGRHGGAEFPAHGRQRLPGESLPGQDALGEGEPAPSLRRPDQQPCPQELHRVPVPVIRRNRRRHPPQARRRKTPSAVRSRAPSPGPSPGPGAAQVPPAAVPAVAAEPESSRQPVVHDVPAFAASAAARFRVRSTAPAATTWRYSTYRDKSSTPPANTDAARKSNNAASSHRRKSPRVGAARRHCPRRTVRRGRCPAPVPGPHPRTE